MVVPVSLRPDRRGEVFRRGRGWIPIEETREYQEQQQREQAEMEYWEERVRKHRIAAGMALIFGDHDG